MKKITLLNDKKLGLIIITLGFLVYLQTLFFKFTYLDDNVLILDHHYFIKKLSNISKAFSQDVFQVTHSVDAYYRPILTVSLILDAQLGKTSAFIYHLTNLGLHLLASWLIFLFFKKLKYNSFLAFLFGLLFAVHPVLTQAVSWIPGRNDSLLAVFIISSFLFFIKYIKTNNWRFLIYHLLFFTLACFTKELSVLLPLLIVLYLLLIYKKKLSLDQKQYFIAGWLGVLLFWFLLRQLALKTAIKYSITNSFQSIYLRLPALIVYIGKIIFPFNLSVLPILPNSNLIYGFVAIVIIILLLFFSKKKKYNFLIFGFIWFLLFLLPSFVRPNPYELSEITEHRLYLPIIGFFIILLEIDFIKKLNKSNKISLFIAGLIIFFFSIINIIHTQNFKNSLSFWQNAVKTSPDYPLSHRNLGAVYYLDNQLDEAEAEFIRTLELNPEEKMAHNNLGLIYLNTNRLDIAEREFNKELKINPYWDTAHFNLALLYFKKNQLDKAVEWWHKTLSINPEYFNAHLNLAFIYLKQNQVDKAAYHVNQVLKKGGQVPPPLLEALQSNTY